MLRTTQTHRTSSGTLLGYTFLHDNGTEQYYAWSDLADQIFAGTFEIEGLHPVSQENKPQIDISNVEAGLPDIQPSDNRAHDDLQDTADETQPASTPCSSSDITVPAEPVPIRGEIINIARSGDGKIRGYNLLVRGTAMYFTGAELKERLSKGELAVDGLYVNNDGKLTLMSGNAGELLQEPAILVKKRKKIVVVKKKTEEQDITLHDTSTQDSGSVVGIVMSEKSANNEEQIDAVSADVPPEISKEVQPGAMVLRLEPKGVPVSMPTEQRTDARKAFIKRRFL